MTPQERQLVDDLFDRLAKLETSPRDPDAEAAMMQGIRRAPNALYALVQTALVQDEALKRASARIQELEQELAAGTTEPRPSGGFLDSMRNAILGPGQTPNQNASQGQTQGSVPSIRPSATDAGQRGPVWNTGQVLGQAPDPRAGYAGPFGGGPFSGPSGGGSSFLGTAAAAAAGVIGGSMLMGGIRNLMGGGVHQSFSDLDQPGRSPWGGNESSSDLARDAGVNDIGHDSGARQSFADQQQQDDRDGNAYDNNDDGYDNDGYDNDDDDFGGDDFGSGDSDYA